MPAWLLVLLLIVGVLVIGAAALMTLSWLVVRRSGTDPYVEGADLSVVANCLGTEGLDRQLLGTGTLAAFPNEVRFLIAAPRRQLEIPRRRLGVTLEQFPNPGDYRKGDDPALVLRWTEQGRRCAIGFRVPDVESWKDFLLR